MSVQDKLINDFLTMISIFFNILIKTKDVAVSKYFHICHHSSMIYAHFDVIK
jgi:hypothetical protein